jgi:monothiol glutaredoxin
MNENVKKKIENCINSSKVFLFMKGSPAFPSCGFSSQAVQILNEYNIEFKSFDILTDNEIRECVKEYADWPTYPQLWVNGKLLGGSDILLQLHEQGKLQKLLEE